MEPENLNTEEQGIDVESEEWGSNLHRVTPLSKYLAMALFVIIPFIGGWIGYNYAPEKVVEVEKVVYLEIQNSSHNDISESVKEMAEDETEHIEATNKVGDAAVEVFSCTTVENAYPHSCFKLIDAQSGVVMVEQMTALAREQGLFSGERTALINTIYESYDGSKIYFMVGIPGSSACCSLVEFNVNTKRFTARSDLHKSVVESIFSSSSRYIASAFNEGVDFKIADLELGEIIYEEVISEGNLQSTGCSMFGFGVDIEFSIYENKVVYGIFEEEKADDDCDYRLIERKSYQIPR